MCHVVMYLRCHDMRMHVSFFDVCDMHVMHAAHVVPRNETAKHPTDHIDTCLGDLYSVGWIELAEKYNLHHWSLQKEFERVQNRTSNHHTFKYVCPPCTFVHVCTCTALNVNHPCVLPCCTACSASCGACSRNNHWYLRRSSCPGFYAAVGRHAAKSARYHHDMDSHGSRCMYRRTLGDTKPVVAGICTHRSLY